MNVRQGDYEGLIREIVLAREKNLGPEMEDEITRQLKTVPWTLACDVVRQISTAEPFPRNLYGAIQRALREARAASEQAVYNRTSWVAKEDCVTPGEAREMARFFREVAVWFYLGLIPRGASEHICDCFDMSKYDDYWNASSFPTTGIGVLDDMLKIYRKAWVHTKDNPRAIEDVLKQMVDTMAGYRENSNHAKAYRLNSPPEAGDGVFVGEEQNTGQERCF